jgi:hypothetical protein
VRRAAPLVLLVALAAAGCGSSSSSNSTTTAQASGNRQQITDCLRKQGVTVPNRPRSASGPQGGGAGFLFGGDQQQRQANPKFQAAAKKCGLNVNRPRRVNLASNPQFKQSIEKFVTCVRKNGYDMPAPNLSGNGPVFDSSKVNRKDPKFVKAVTKCQSLLSLGPPPAQ